MAVRKVDFSLVSRAVADAERTANLEGAYMTTNARIETPYDGEIARYEALPRNPVKAFAQDDAYHLSVLRCKAEGYRKALQVEDTRRKALVEALREIAKGTGRDSRIPAQIAQAALKAAGEEA